MEILQLTMSHQNIDRVFHDANFQDNLRSVPKTNTNFRTTDPLNHASAYTLSICSVTLGSLRSLCVIPFSSSTCLTNSVTPTGLVSEMLGKFQ